MSCVATPHVDPVGPVGEPSTFEWSDGALGIELEAAVCEDELELKVMVVVEQPVWMSHANYYCYYLYTLVHNYGESLHCPQ